MNDEAADDVDPAILVPCAEEGGGGPSTRVERDVEDVDAERVEAEI